ncbi:MAG: AAA family ATPase [Nakamurella sp.]
MADATVVDARPPRRLVGFQVTRQHRRFCEFADAVRRSRYIGICYGQPGLGKTASARTYAAADDWDRWLADRYERAGELPDSLRASRTVMYTPFVHVTGRRLFMEVDYLARMLSNDINTAINPLRHPSIEDADSDLPMACQLVVIDEADRLKPTALEQLRDFFDRTDLGLMLIGMPGFDRQLARYPQLYSRIGFAHQYKPLDADDMPTVLGTYWQQLGYAYQPDDTDHVEAANAITTITGGNFRLIERLMTQIARVMEINHLDHIAPDVVHAARQMLVIGAR